MLNVRISKAQFEALTEQERAHYVQKGEQYVLDVNGDTEEMTTLRQQNVSLHQKVLKAETNAAEANAKVATAATDAETKYKTQIDTANATVKTMQEQAVKTRQTSLIDGIATKFKQPELFRGVLREQVKVEFNDKNELVESFVNEKGETVTLEQLTDAYCKAPQYSAMLTTPTSTATMPTNQPPAGSNAPQNAPAFSGFNGAQAPAGGGSQANWGMDANGKPAVYNWAAMTDAETSAYAAAKLAAN